MDFTWHENKNEINIEKHGIDFIYAQEAFFDPKKLIINDKKHSTPDEHRYFCFGMVNGKVATVRFTITNNIIRIFGAGYWRQGRKRYEKENQL
ncbi:MAG: BrnT family toxin [Spirochaetia bacterium]|jgi:uncharacterized DUF497 family protein|nr:BrnT family toxin [Spirochaetia bacterium]